MADNKIQQLIDSGSSLVVLPPGEYKGPFYVGHPCIIEGNSTTLWNCGDTVFAIDSEGVTLRNLRIEMIDDSEKCYSLCTAYPVKTEEVEIIGPVSGFGAEDKCPEMSKQLKLGTFSSEKSSSYIFELYSPGKSVLETDMQDIVLEPTVLAPGINRVKLTTGKLPSGTFIYGDILMKSLFNRRFYVQGMAAENAESADSVVISTVGPVLPDNDAQSDNSECLRSVRDRLKSQSAVSNQNTVQNKNDNRRPPEIKSSPDNSPVHVLSRGERISIENYSNKPLKIYMGYRALFSEIEIDPYAFMLDEKGVTSCDDDFVFFGNRETMSGTLTFRDDKSVELDLSRVPDHIKRISFVYSIYQPGPNDNFSKVMDPFISVLQENKEIIRYTASELFAETTIIFMDIYKHSSGWKLNTIGQGYREGLKRLCANYGLIVN